MHESRLVKLGGRILIAPLLFTTLAMPLSAQRNNYYNGVRDGGRGGNYDRGPQNNYRDGYDDRYHHQGGIGPGKGALIGAGGGAVLGALFGGGAKGALIGGAAGAGVGALAGKAAQNHRRDEY